MSNFNVAFDSPWYLLLLLLVPVLWIWSFKSLSGLGTWRRFFALVLRTAVFVALVLALANVQLLRTMDKMTVIYLLDQSASIPPAQRQAMVEYVRAEVAEHRDDSRGDKASVIIFGREANVESPPLDDNVLITGVLESISNLRDDGTNLLAAMEIAKGLFPEDSAKRIVIVTDGNENLGQSRPMAQLLARDGIGVDIVPVRLETNAEVAVERVILPSDIRRGEPFETRVVMNNLMSDSADGTGIVQGTLRLTRRVGQRTETLDQRDVELTPGKKVFTITQEIDQPDFYEIQAAFIPADAKDDRLQQNNRATSFTHVRGKSQVLLIENFENRDASGVGEFQTLVDRLRGMDIEVTVQFSDELFSSFAELQRFDCVILANVPRSSGLDDARIYNFSDQQVRMLVRNTQEMGCGLIMMGGQQSFGAGGWSNSELEKAMPVDFQIHNAKVQAVGALAMIFHASEMPDGNNMQKKIGREALKVLGPQDYCGVVHWNRRESWLWGEPQGLIRVGGKRQQMMGRLGRMTPGDMPDFDPAMKMSAAAFAAVQSAAVKHMIIISDGDPTPPTGNVISQLTQLGVKVSTVAVGGHGRVGSATLQRIATQTGGKYYAPQDPKALPKIFQKEARQVTRPLLYEKRVQPRIKSIHQILEGIDAPPPPTNGFVMTTLKQNPLVNVQLVSPQPPDERNATIMASWQYGAGRTIAFTTDAGKRWATDWTGWEPYDKMFSQMVRWASRPSGDTGDFIVSTDVQDGKIKLVVTALDENDEFQNFLGMSATSIDPNMQSSDIEIHQTAPGRYVGQFDAAVSGSYFLSVFPGGDNPPIRVGVNVPYSDEFRDRETNQALLETLVSLQPEGGDAGTIISGPLVNDPKGLQQLLETNTFRHTLAKAVSSDYVWPLLLLAAGCVFLADVFIRRVAISFAWITPLYVRAMNTMLRRKSEPEADTRLERLRSRKAQIGDNIDQRRAAARFEPTTDEADGATILREPIANQSNRREIETPKPIAEIAQEQPEEEYTSRLLKAKKQVWKDRDKPDE